MHFFTATILKMYNKIPPVKEVEYGSLDRYVYLCPPQNFSHFFGKKGSLQM